MSLLHIFSKKGRSMTANARLLAASDHLIDSMPDVLTAAQIEYHREPTKTFVQGRHYYELSMFRCEEKSSIVDLGIEKRRGRKGAYIVLTPANYLFFFPRTGSELLAEKLVTLLCDHGATESPEVRCEDL